MALCLRKAGSKMTGQAALPHRNIQTAKANGLNIFQYLYTLLLYMPDYKDEPAGIEQLMPWSEFIKERCTGITDIENVRPENRGNLNI